MPNDDKQSDNDKKDTEKKDAIDKLLLSDNKKTLHDAFTLDTFLSFLDGYTSLHGCILIMTTNRINMLDPAIIRPGRIDHIIELKKCDSYQFNSMFKFFTGKNVPKDFVFEENKYTTSYLINTIIVPNKNNPEIILNKLKSQ